MDYAKAYAELHQNQKHFLGYSILPHVERIKGLVEDTGSRTLLDYGCGKGFQYLKERVHEAWGILPYCYDPGVRAISDKPQGKFDGVICTDVLEHIEESDVPGVLDELVGYAHRFVFLAICCRPAGHKRLPDGRDVHVTVKPPEWWEARIRGFEGPKIAAVYT